MQPRRAQIFVPVLFLLILVAPTLAQHRTEAAPEFSVKEHYTKYEYRIPMRDGVHLFTSVYVPKDVSHSYPFLIERTPYSVGPYGEDEYLKHLGPTPDFDKAGYVFAFQDVRGRYMSEGKFVEMTPHIDNKKSNQDVDDSSDLYDTIEWLLKHVPNNNGNAGIWGISYDGFYTSASIIDSHPALKAASPQAPMTDLFMGDDTYHGGAFMLAANFDFYTFFKTQANPTLPTKRGGEFDYGTKSAYDFYLKVGSLQNLSKLLDKPELFNDQMFHDTYDDYWKVRDLAPHMKNVHCAVLTVGGWFDAEDLQGPFSTFHAIEKNNPGIFNALVVGPWVHGGWARLEGEHLGRVEFNSKTGDFYRENIVFPFFERYLKGVGEATLPKAYVFETGSNVWRKYSEWPPKQAVAKTLYLRPNGGLSFDRPSDDPPSDPAENSSTSPAGAGFDEYLSDPTKPVPFVNYIDPDVPQEYMDSDQRFASTRTDVLVYQSGPLREDVTIAGPVSPRLFVSTSGTDSDFDVKLIDMYPADYPNSKLDTSEEDDKPRSDVGAPTFLMGGYQQLVRGEPFRGKFRHSFEKPEPFTPGKVEEIVATFQDVNHTFRSGHRIMVQIQSSWFPLTDRNPQTFVDIPHAKPADFVKATERVYHTQREPSGIRVGVLPGPALGEAAK